ncbi:MAG: extracellular solute-binding protein [Clostridia bacterium]|nr:extracellular solute-binding protein [Clostridia bacterium]
MRKLLKTTVAVKFISLVLFPCIVMGLISFPEPSCHPPRYSYDVVRGTVTLTCPKDIYPTDESREVISEWIKYFNSVYPDVTVQTEFDDRANWDVRLASKDIGDVFWADDSQVYELGMEKRYLMPLDSYAEYFEEKSDLGLDLNDVYPILREIGTADGQLYMIAERSEMQTFTYNKGMLAEAGLELPPNDWTWYEFKEYIKKLTVMSENGTVLQVGAAMDITSPQTYIFFCTGTGGELFDQLNEEVDFSSKNAVRGLKKLTKVLEDKYVYPMSELTLTGEYASAFAEINNENIISKAAFIQLDSYSKLQERAALYALNGIDWDIVSFPDFEYAASPCSSCGYGVFSYTSNPAAAAALCLSIWTIPVQTEISQGLNCAVPVLKSMQEDTVWHYEEYSEKNYDAFLYNVGRAIPGDFRGRVPEKVADIIEDGMTRIFIDFYSDGVYSEDDALYSIDFLANDTWESLHKPRPVQTPIYTPATTMN